MFTTIFNFWLKSLTSVSNKLLNFSISLHLFSASFNLSLCFLRSSISSLFLLCRSVIFFLSSSWLFFVTFLRSATRLLYYLLCSLSSSAFFSYSFKTCSASFILFISSNSRFSSANYCICLAACSFKESSSFLSLLIAATSLANSCSFSPLNSQSLLITIL